MFFRRPTVPGFVQTYLDAPRPDLRLPWRSASYVVLDIETSGLVAKRDAILAIGLVEIKQGRIQVGQRWRSLVRPPDGLLVGVDSIRVHGILRDELAVAPPIDKVLPQLLARLTGHILVVHVASIDIGFLNQAMERLYRVKLRGPAIDTARLAMTLHHNERFLGGAYPTEPPPVQLRALAERAGLPVHAEHDALNDALTTAQLFLAQATQLDLQGIATIGGILKAGGVLK